MVLVLIFFSVPFFYHSDPRSGRNLLFNFGSFGNLFIVFKSVAQPPSAVI